MMKDLHFFSFADEELKLLHVVFFDLAVRRLVLFHGSPFVNVIALASLIWLYFTLFAEIFWEVNNIDFTRRG